jgi:LPXTG-motif cell wall-anchored protein
LFRREQTPACTAVSVDVGVGAVLTARAAYTGEKMDTNTLIVIVLVVLLLGGGGFFYRRRA